MRHFQSGLTVFCIFVAVSYARADLLWDNFLTPPNGFDDTRVWSSEQDTTVPTGSWTVDDANLGSVTVQSIRWAGARLENHSYSAEVIILNSQFGEITDFTAPTFTTLGTFGLVAGYRRYVAEVTIPDLALAPGDYFVGVRLISNDGGRNFTSQTGNGTIHGNSQGNFKSDYFGYPNWTPIDQIHTFDPNDPFFPASDLAFQLYGIVPEPASWLAATIVLVLLRRR